MAVSASQRLLEFNPAVADSVIASIIADLLLESDRQPYVFGIYHSVRAPKYEACPVDYDWTLGGRVGIHTSIRLKARVWIREAALRGYAISRADPKTHRPEGPSISIKSARDRAAWFRDRKSREENDDDIPF